MKFPAFCLFLLACLLLLPTTAFGAEAPKPIKLFMNEKQLDSVKFSLESLTAIPLFRYVL